MRTDAPFNLLHTMSRKKLAAIIGGIALVIVLLLLMLNREIDDLGTPAANPTLAATATTQPVAPGTAAASMPAGAMPKIAITINGSRETQVMRGWPMVVRATLLHPAAFGKSQSDEPIILKGDTASWTGSVRIAVRDAKQNEVTWPLQAAGSAPAQATLQKNEALTADWVLSPEQTAALPDGSYELTAVLQAGGGVASTASVPAEATVRQPPATLDDEQQSELHLLTATYHFTRGDPAAAGVELDRLLAKQPAHVTALALKAELLASQNRFDEAIEACGKAIDAHLEQSDGDEPPHALLALQRDLLNAANREE